MTTAADTRAGFFQRIASFYHDMMTEMRKVTWPSTSDVVDSSLVVIATVVVLGVFLAGTDALLGSVFRYLLFPAVRK